MNGDWQKTTGRRWWWSRRRLYTLASCGGVGAVSRKAGYRYVWFDTLNRYVAEADELARCLEPPRPPSTGLPIPQSSPRWRRGASDHRLASLLAGSAAGCACRCLERDPSSSSPAISPSPRSNDRAGANDAEQAMVGVGPNAVVSRENRGCPRPAPTRIYAALVDSDRICAASGRFRRLCLVRGADYAVSPGPRAIGIRRDGL